MWNNSRVINHSEYDLVSLYCLHCTDHKRIFLFLPKQDTPQVDVSLFRDLKPDNILVKKGILKIADLGNSKDKKKEMGQ